MCITSPHPCLSLPSPLSLSPPFPSPLPFSLSPSSCLQHLKPGAAAIGVGAADGATGMNRLTVPQAGQGLSPDPFLRKVTKLPRRRQPTQSSARYTSQRLPPDYHPLPLLRGACMHKLQHRRGWRRFCAQLNCMSQGCSALCLNLFRYTHTHTHTQTHAHT